MSYCDKCKTELEENHYGGWFCQCERDKLNRYYEQEAKAVKEAKA